jgi:6-phosphogluconolactonase (cycloisomerase 2 family)
VDLSGGTFKLLQELQTSVDITADRIVSSQGVNPNSISLDPEGQFLAVANQHMGPTAIAVLKREEETGALGDEAEATLNFDKVSVAPNGFGPLFVTPLRL